MLVLTDDRKKGQTSVRFSFPCGVAVDQDDNIFITDTNNKRIVQMSRGGKFLKEIAPGGKKYFITLCILFLRNQGSHASSKLLKSPHFPFVSSKLLRSLQISLIFVNFSSNLLKNFL